VSPARTEGFRNDERAANAGARSLAGVPRIGVFLGLNGIVIKSHGGTDEIGFKAALGLAYEMARSHLIDKIGEGMRRFPALPAEAPATPQPEGNPA
jgi:hypothetical protein